MTPLAARDATELPADAALGHARALVDRLLAIAFLALLVAAGAALWLSYAEAGREGRRNAENLASVLSEYLGIRLGTIDSVLTKVVASSRRIGGPGASEREWSTALRTATSGVTGLSAIVITDANGRVTYSTVLQIIGESWAERPIFRALAEGRRNLLVADTPLSIGAGNERLIPFGRVLTDARGELIGMAIVTLVPDQLQDFYRAFDLGQAGAAWVVLPSGTVLFRAGSDEASPDSPSSELPALAAGNIDASEGFIRGPLGPGGPDYLTAYQRSNVANLVVAVSLSADGILSRWRYEALAVAVFVAAAGVFLLFARRRIGRAMANALEAARG
jgi:hypothetical protein